MVLSRKAYKEDSTALYFAVHKALIYLRLTLNDNYRNDLNICAHRLDNVSFII